MASGSDRDAGFSEGDVYENVDLVDPDNVTVSSVHTSDLSDFVDDTGSED